jgi:hypothetical protein
LEQIKLRIETVAAVTFTTFVTAGIRGVGWPGGCKRNCHCFSNLKG